MTPFKLLPIAALAAGFPASRTNALEVVASNPLAFARHSETIEIPAAALAPLGEADLSKIHVRDAKGVEVVCQAIDNDGDPLRRFDAVIFQADFAADETLKFTVSKGAKQVFKKEQFKAFGRFNRERFDDFVWENDRIAHRTYGKALETWEGEPLTSSTIDIWSKRTPRMVVNDWYLADDYHVDHGEGAARFGGNAVDARPPEARHAAQGLRPGRAFLLAPEPCAKVSLHLGGVRHHADDVHDDLGVGLGRNARHRVRARRAEALGHHLQAPPRAVREPRSRPAASLHRGRG